MADRRKLVQGYDYNSMSNLVYAPDRRNVVREAATGEAESLWGRLGNTRMGDRARPEKPKELKEQLEKLKKRAQKSGRVAAEALERRRLKHEGPRDVLAATSELEIAVYRPRTRETRAVYEQMLGFVHKLVGDQPQDVLRGAVDDVLEILKNDELNDPERKRRVEELFTRRLEDERFAELARYGRGITDFHAQTANNDAIDDEHGVAVVIEGESDDEDNVGGMTAEVVEADDSDEDGVEADAGRALGDDDMVGGADADADAVTGAGGPRLDANDIDAFWLQRQIGAYVSDPQECQALALRVLQALEIEDVQELENQLVLILEIDKFSLIHTLTKNRDKIYWTLRLRRARTAEEKQQIEQHIDSTPELRVILDEIEGRVAAAEAAASSKDAQRARAAAVARAVSRGSGAAASSSSTTAAGASAGAGAAGSEVGRARSRKLLDLEGMAFQEGGHLLSNKRVAPPAGSYRVEKRGYEEVHVPAPKAKVSEHEELVRISSLPEWAQPAFKGMKTLNRIQSTVFRTAFEDAQNMLLCAPTGAGKTNVAMLTILHELGVHRDADSGRFRLEDFKVVYVAPMKALVQECVQNFSHRLQDYGVVVRELSGDQQLSREQIEETNIIVTTPEKWDIVTRKAGHRAFTQLVRLIIIDEIHLLHDDRGPVLESLVARTLRQVEHTGEMIRIVGLSATLPNYEDVALFLRVELDTGLFHFDATYRPCPLEQQYIGITEKKAMKRTTLMNQILYEKLVERAGVHQVIVFVHSRKETAKTARSIIETAMADDNLVKFLANLPGSRQVLAGEVANVTNLDLKELLPHGFGIHHAGMNRRDRALVEDLFGDKHIQVLFSTATLAWGVNLPAHTVIIKGTQVYNPEKGRWVELSHLDVMQMLGRAGRPAYDTQGEGILITTNQELKYYLALLNESLPIESQMVRRLADHLNAEIVLGTVQNAADAVNWLGYTYLYVRLLRNPSLYGVSAAVLDDDEYLEQFRADLVHTAATILDKCNLVNYDRRTGNFQVTDLGRIASYYYITHQSMATYNDYLKPTMNDIELLRLFSLSSEFQYINVREEEKIELTRLHQLVPVPIKDNLEDKIAKVNILLQAYIAQLKMEGFALASDMVYITQSAGRIMRALFEITLKRGWAPLALRCLNYSLMISRKQWAVQTPLRQFPDLPEDVKRRIEKKDIPWERYYDFSAQELGQLVHYDRLGKHLHAMVHQVPRLVLDAHVQPVMRSMLRVELTITPEFLWNEKVHGSAEPFWILVEDGDGERILHSEYFVLKQRFAQFEHTLDFTLPIFDPLPPHYFIRAVSDRWLGSQTVLPISFAKLLLPNKNPPPTELLDLQPLRVAALRNPAFEGLYAPLEIFNPIQTQVFTVLYTTDDNCLVAAPPGSGKTICAEFAVLRAFAQGKERVVYVAPMAEICDETFGSWAEKFGKLGKTVVQLTGDTAVDIKLLSSSNVVLATASQWDAVYRRWKQKAFAAPIDLFIVDELHLVGDQLLGPCLEIVTSRMRFVAAQAEHKTRIVGLSASVADAKDLGEWLGATPQTTFNFPPAVRPLPLEITLQAFDTAHFQSRMLAMSRPAFGAIVHHSRDKPVLIFVPSRKQCGIVGFNLLQDAGRSEDERPFLRCSEDDLLPFLRKVQDKTLQHHLTYGVGILHEGLVASDRELVLRLASAGAVQVVVCAYSQAWGLPLTAQLVIIYGTEYYDGQAHRYVPYQIPDILQMMGRANRPLEDTCGKVVVLCHAPRKKYLKKFLNEPLPVESRLDLLLADHFNAEIVASAIENKQEAVDYLTWTFMYRRLTQNSNYYGLKGTSRRHLSDYLSELVENTLDSLAESQCINIVDDFDVRAANLGMIAAHYYIQYLTMHTFATNVRERMKMRSVLEVVCNAAEFDTVPVRQREEFVLAKLSKEQKWAPSRAHYTDPHTKVFVLMQAHFSRTSLPAELQSDLNAVLGTIHGLLYALVDVVTSNGWLQPALQCMELCQMATQAMWDTDHLCRQLPGFTSTLLERCAARGIKTIDDLLEMDDDERTRLVEFSPKELAYLASVCNRYPSVALSFELASGDEELVEGERATLFVELEREWEEETLPPVFAPFFPRQKDEVWWLVLGDASSVQVSAIKRVALLRKARVKLDFVVPPAATQALKLTFMCDSYLGCDQEHAVPLRVGARDADAME